jgi:hypothetical protein
LIGPEDPNKNPTKVVSTTSSVSRVLASSEPNTSHDLVATRFVPGTDMAAAGPGETAPAGEFMGAANSE